MIERGTVDEFEQRLEEDYPNGMSECELNDLLWFDDYLTGDYIYDYELIDFKITEETAYFWYRREDGLNLFYTEMEENPKRDYADWEIWDNDEAQVWFNEWFDDYGKEV